MELSLIIAEVKKQAQNAKPFGGTLKFVLDEHPIFIDGNNDNAITEEDCDADCTISMSSENLLKMKNGDLNPMMAVMTGKIKIKGDMGLAMKLQNLL
jgi:putative sterol carrier protein